MSNAAQQIRRKKQVTEHEAKTLVCENPHLAAAADIANGSKHLTLTKPPRPTASFGPHRYELALAPSTAPPTVRVRYTITHSGTTYDAVKLTTDCLAAWDSFLRNKGLL